MIRTRHLAWLLLVLASLVVTPAVADEYLVYSEKGIGQSPCDGGACFLGPYCIEGDGNCQTTEPGCLWSPCSESALGAGECDVPEGNSYQRAETSYFGGDPAYVGWGAIPLACPFCELVPQDMTDFAGDLSLFVRVSPALGSGSTNHNVKVEFECRPDDVNFPAGVSYVTYVTDHGYQQTTDWQEISIPIEPASFPVALDLSQPNPSNEFGFEIISPHPPVDAACIQNVTAWVKVTLANVDSSTVFAEMSVDYVRWRSPNNHTGASNVTTNGRQLEVDGKPFIVNGVAYSPVAIGENWQFTWQDRADRYNIDYPAMVDLLGVNAVRVYAPLVTTSMLDKAWEEGMFVIPTFEVESKNLECAAGKAHLQDRFAETAAEWKDHPAILFWLVGNEVNQNLGAANLCTDWYPTLDAMAAAAEAAGATQPVGTAVAGVTDLCNSCSGDTELPNVDLWGVQLYPGSNFGTAFNAYSADPDCERPLIITEVGVDAYDRPTNSPGSENQTAQASYISSLLEDASADLTVRPGGLEVLSGLTIFEYADEWHKAECSATASWSSQEICSSWNAPFFDGKAHEEWFGVVALDAADSTLRPARLAASDVGEKWLGPVCHVQVDAFNGATGDATVSFTPPSGGAVDTNLHYGPLSAVSSYSYSGSLAGLGTTGTANVTLPAGDLFWIVTAENMGGEEACYGMDSAGAERPCVSGSCDVDQISGWNCWCTPAGSP